MPSKQPWARRKINRLAIFHVILYTFLRDNKEDFPMKYDFTLIGAGVVDVLARPVDASVFSTGSLPANDILISFGGDALNEATILSRLGKSVQFISILGQDDAGNMILEHLKRNHIPTEYVTLSNSFSSPVNLVLVDKDGERSFITNPQSSLRMLDECHVDSSLLPNAPILCFASIFVSPKYTPDKLERLFQNAKNAGCIVCADMTKCKNQETLADIAPALSYVDYIFPNYEEARLVSRLDDPDEIADAFLKCGVRHVVMKLGKKGCLLKTPHERYLIPAYAHANCVDTTGAGDNFAAGFLYALSEGMRFADCGRFANATASIAIEHTGATTGVQSLAQIMERYSSLDEK